MPQFTGAVDSYKVTGKKQSLMDIYNLVGKYEQPFKARIGATDKPKQTLHEWTKDTLAKPGDNAQVEGMDATTYQGSNVVPLQNNTQILTKFVKVTGTAEEIQQAGVSRQFAHQKSLRMKELSGDEEYAYLSNNINSSGTDTTARRMRGLSAWLTTNVDLGAGGAAATATAPAVAGTLRPLTVGQILAVQQGAYDNGGNPSTMMCASGLRTKLTDVLKPINVANEDAKDKKVVDTVDVFESPFGIMRALTNRVQKDVPYAKNALFILDWDYWKKAYLRPLKQEELAKTGDSMRAMLVLETTLVAKAEESSGMVADILIS